MKQFNRSNLAETDSLSKAEGANHAAMSKKHRITVKNTGSKDLQLTENRINRKEI